LTAVRDAVAGALSAPMILSDGARQWSLAPEDLATMVRVVPPHDGQPAAAELDEAALTSLGEQLAGKIDRPAVDAGVDETGDVARLVEAQTGRTVRVADFAATVRAAFAGGQHAAAIPIDEIAPGKTTEALLASLGATDLLATGTSDFAGSEPGRATNVRVASELIDGVMVPPHGHFTFNHSIGEINATPGFVPAGASENGIPGTANGGGVCQVTTTVFRAALKAGLPIDEWWPHAYRNAYYEQGGWAPGFDASVQQPDDDPFGGSDFVFENPTDGWLMVRSEIADETKLSVEVYGPPTGYTVQLGDPINQDVVSADQAPTQESVDPTLPPATVDLVQPARDGMTVTVVRRVYDADGNLVSNDRFVSHYEPQGAAYRVSSDKAGSTGGGE
jgi:vancomycin resistance protein YoaR